MKESAENQLKQIDLNDVKETLKKLVPEKYDKMIVSGDIKRGDNYLTKYEYTIVSRELKAVDSPLYPEFEKFINELEAKDSDNENKTTLPDNSSFQDLIFRNSSNVETDSTDDRLNFTLSKEGDSASKDQPIFYFTNSIDIHSCPKCHEEKYVTCDSYPCEGRHEWECDKCVGSGKISCKDCNGEGWVRCGGFLSGCGGSGKVKTTVKNASGTTSQKLVNCSKCSGKGKVKCTTCNTTGQVKCTKCNGRKTLVCSKCYGDKQRYGLIDCSHCSTQGRLFNLNFVQSNLLDGYNQFLYKKGDSLQITDDQIEKFFSEVERPLLTYRNINEVDVDSYDQFSKELSIKSQEQLNVNLTGFPRLLEEKVAYKIVPCVEFSFNHILTNETHSGVILNFWENPEVIFYSEPEEVKQSIGNIGKATKGFFSKMFKTKSHLQKVDRKTEMKLLIYLAKSDGKIEEEEKVYISNQIQNLQEFTNSEKKEFFSLMDLQNLPELTEKDIVFSNREVADEVLNKLEELAKSDGEVEDSEIAFINKVRSLVK